MVPSAARIISQTLLVLSLLELPAAAAQVWVGTGRIAVGVGQGGSVELRLVTENEVVKSGDWVKSLHGPPLNGRVQGETIQNNFGSWQFRQCSQNLCITLTRTNPRQTIIYRLRRSDRGRIE